MQAIFAKGNQRTVNKLTFLRKEAIRDHQYRVATRLHAVTLSIEKHTSGQIANLLKVNRTNVPDWIHSWNNHGSDGLLEGHRSGRKNTLNNDDKIKLEDILESGPVAYGLNTGVWTSKIVTQIIGEEFGIEFHPGHVRKLLKEIGFSVQRPTYKLVNADAKKKNKWIRYTYPNLKKKPERKGR
ncbi:MAG: winged helix-turn-helix domain-containing protein [Candidatus Poribacteria bacterium]